MPGKFWKILRKDEQEDYKRAHENSHFIRIEICFSLMKQLLMLANHSFVYDWRMAERETYAAIAAGKIVTDISVARENEWASERTNENNKRAQKFFHRNEFHNQNALHSTFRINYNSANVRRIFATLFGACRCAVCQRGDGNAENTTCNFFFIRTRTPISLQPSDTPIDNLFFETTPEKVCEWVCASQNRTESDTTSLIIISYGKAFVYVCVSMYVYINLISPSLLFSSFNSFICGCNYFYNFRSFARLLALPRSNPLSLAAAILSVICSSRSFTIRSGLMIATKGFLILSSI